MTACARRIRSSFLIAVVVVFATALIPTAEATADVSVSGDTTFGPIAPGESETHTFTFTNTGTETITSMTASILCCSSDFSGGVSCGTLGPGASCQGDVTLYSPEYSFPDCPTGGNIRLRWYDESGTREFQNSFGNPVTGCVLEPEASISPTIKNFGDVAVDDAVAQLMVIENVGQVNLRIMEAPSIVDSGPVNFDFVDEGDTCQTNVKIPPGQSCHFYVVFSPVSRGPKDATLVIPTDERTSPGEPTLYNEVELQGNGGPSGYPRARSASPIRLSFVPAFLKCQGPTRTHGEPLAHPSCYPPTQFSHYLTVGTPDANGRTTNSTGSEVIVVQAGNPDTPEDEADISLNFSVSDVRNRQDLSDYSGELQATHTLRITDRANGDPRISGTVIDTPLTMTVPCSVTSGTSTGSTCSISTTADTLIPGTVQELDRTVWEVAQVRVMDGGEDGDVDTADNLPFLVPGVFVP